jgi:hypothetical protein
MRQIDPDQEPPCPVALESRAATRRARAADCALLQVAFFEAEQYHSSCLASVFRRDRENLVGDPRKGNDDICTTAGNRLFRHTEHDGGGFMFGYGH